MIVLFIYLLIIYQKKKKKTFLGWNDDMCCFAVLSKLQIKKIIYSYNIYLNYF